MKKYVSPQKREQSGMTDAYAAVLIDGNTTEFKIKLWANELRTGVRAAQLLNDAVQEHLANTDCIPPNIPIIVKIFATPGENADRLFPFAASFSSAYAHCNFIPVADKEMVKVKISENFELFDGDENCKYVLLAVNHEPTYGELLSSCKGRVDIGLLRAGLVHVDYQLLNLEMVELSNIFLDPTNDWVDDSDPEPESTFTQDRIPNLYNLLQSCPFEKKGLIPINKDGNRIDYLVPTALRAEEKAFNMRHEVHKLCLNHHIGTDGCQRMFCSIDTKIAKWVQPFDVQPGSKAAMKSGTLIDFGVLDEDI